VAVTLYHPEKSSPAEEWNVTVHFCGRDMVAITVWGALGPVRGNPSAVMALRVQVTVGGGVPGLANVPVAMICVGEIVRAASIVQMLRGRWCACSVDIAVVLQ
jgi:hypothetical protein